MNESPFEDIPKEESYFFTPQLENAFKSMLEEVHSGRLLSCVVGFPKSGKTTFSKRLAALLLEHTIVLTASTTENLSQALSNYLSPQGDTSFNFPKELQEKMRIVLIIDDAHLLQDEDFAFLSSLFTLAKHKNNVLQVILVGNKELVHKLARPDNRGTQILVGNISNLPKLTREQSFGYIRFLLNSAGLDKNLISNPAPLVRRAAGVIGMLRILTITLALRALSGQDISNMETALDLPTQEESTENKVSGQEIIQEKLGLSLAWPGHLLVLGTIFFIALATLIFIWAISDSKPLESFSKSITGMFTSWSGEYSEPGFQNIYLETTPPVMGPPTAQTIFRKKSKDGPYSLLLGTYPTIEALCLHLPRISKLNQPVFWNKESFPVQHFALFIGRFHSMPQAKEFISKKKLEGATIVLKPFVVTVGPLSEEEVAVASFAVGLPQRQRPFERKLVAGVEVQFGLTNDHSGAMDLCALPENQGYPCAITLSQ